MLSTKETLVEAIRADGFDFITACEYADAIIRRARAAGGVSTHHVGTLTITLERVG